MKRYKFFLIVAIMMGMAGCTEEEPGLPTVVTGLSEAYSTTHTFMCKGDVIDDGGSPVTERGICYLQGTATPTLEDAHETAGSGKGVFSCVMENVSTGVYSYRAYAVNKVGIAYGEVRQVSVASNSATVVTVNATANVSNMSAVCSGNVTDDGGSAVTARGICYMKGSGNPTVNNSKVAGGSGTGSFSCTLQDLSVGTYSYRAYATNEAGTVYGATKTFSFPAFDEYGASTTLFPVSATKKVRFAKGNLRYQPSAHKWRIAGDQYNFQGDLNESISSYYSGEIDLFGYGTSGCYSGATCYQPYSTNKDETKYLSADLTDQYANADWGRYNTIYYGSHSSTGWRTLTASEWSYLLQHCRFGLATLGVVKGLIILPPGYTMPSGLTFQAGSSNGWNTNTYTLSDWLSMEAEGAIFLPAAGERDGTDWISSGCGAYWSATSDGSNYISFALFFNSYGMYSSNQYTYLCGEPKSYGCAVRLVKDN